MTTPATGLTPLREDDLNAALEELLLPRLMKYVASRSPGHCMRIDDIDIPLATRLTRLLRDATPGEVQVLGTPPEVPADVAVSSTKVVELRNPGAGGELRSPLLVFIPPGARTSAEDSFGVATFEQVELGDVYRDLVTSLLHDVPDDLRPDVEQLFRVLSEEQWLPAGPPARARYLLTARLNGWDDQTAGAALYELGLVPDREFFRQNVASRTSRIVKVMRKLTEPMTSDRQRVLALELTDERFQADLAEYVAEQGLADPRAWTRRIVLDRRNWRFFFDNWPLPEPTVHDAVDIEVTQLGLPSAKETDPDEIRRSIVGQHYLPTGSTGQKEMNVSFVLRQQREQVIGLERFRVQIIAEGGDADDDPSTGISGTAMEISSTVKARRTPNQRYVGKLTKLLRTTWEQGWYFVRVTALDENGSPLRHVEAPDDEQRGHPDYESDRFYVIPDGIEIEPPAETRSRRVAGVTQAARILEFSALDEGRPVDAITVHSVRWKQAANRGGADAAAVPLVAKFTVGGTFEIPLSPSLADLQRRILSDPDHAGQWRMELTIAGAGGGVDTPSQSAIEWGSLDAEAATAFLAARRDLFARIRSGGDEEREPEVSLPVEGGDLIGLRAYIVAYAEAYQNLLIGQRAAIARATGDRAQAMLRDLNALARLDTVAVELVDHRWEHHELVLVAPTHPLKLLWLLTWSLLGRDWAARLGDSGAARDDIAAVRATLFDAIRPLGYPIAVPMADGRLAAAAFDLTPYWEVCLLSGTTDPQGLVALLETGLCVPERSASSDAWSARALADRMERYLRQHPYVRTLVINAFNVGRGDELAEAMAVLHNRPGLGEIGFELRLFVADPEAPGVADAIAEPLSEGEPGFPLTVSVLNRKEFLTPGEEWPAHLTLLFDALSAERVGTVRDIGTDPDAYAPVHGLIQEMDVRYDAAASAWSKNPRHGRAKEIPDAEELTVLLGGLPATLSAVVATLATGDAETTQVPQMTLSLNVADSTLLDAAHRVSDWVLTVDRTFGVELFDERAGGSRPEYVIDYAPETGTELGHHIIVSSRSLDELRYLLRPVLDQQDVHIEERHVATFFEQLRLLSGRLAFRIASTAANQRSEVFGLALARLFLEYQGDALRNQILVPLDAHLDLYSEIKARAGARNTDADLRRTDLALFDINARNRAITCRLVEVKCHAGAGMSGYSHLKEQIKSQLKTSAAVLAQHFDPIAHERPDRPAKNHQLASLLRFYLDRGVRHQVIAANTAEEAHWLLDRLDGDEGFTLNFTRTGLIFDLAQDDDSETEFESGVEFHWIGRIAVQELLDNVPTRPEIVGQPDPAATVDDATTGISTFADLSLSVPRPADAVFQPAPRIRDLPGPVEEPVDEDQPSVTEDADVDPSQPAEPGPEIALTTDKRADRPLAADHADDDQREPEIEEPAAVPEPAVSPDIYLGSSGQSPQYGVLARAHGRRIAVDLNETHTISLFGVQGGGKSYTLGSIIEMASLSAPPVNRLTSPLATVVFHYSQTQDYAPEFTTMAEPNDDPGQVQALLDHYAGRPAGLTDIVLLAPEAQCERRREEYPSLDVRPLSFDSAELQMTHWKFLMGAVGNQATYIRQITQIMRQNRNALRLDVLRDAVSTSSLPDHLKQLADQRLDLAAEYIEDGRPIKDLVRPGRLIIVDLRDEFIEKDEALGLFVVLMNLFAEARDQAGHFNKLVVFDEAHKYIDSPDLVKGLVENVREMRHKGMSVLVASQDPPSVPISLIELSDHIFVHKCTSPGWLKHLKNANAAFGTVTTERLAELRPGEAYVWSSKATDPDFTQRMIKVVMRPRLTRHGGGTKTATG